MAFAGTYNLKDKIIAGAEIYYVGKRYALPLRVMDSIMNSVVDLNLQWNTGTRRCFLLLSA